MSNLERKVNAMIRIQLASDESEKEAALAELKQLSTFDDAEPAKNYWDVLAEEMIHELLAKIGVPTANLGHKYLVYGICEVVKNPGLTDIMLCGFYPRVAMEFDTSPSRVERAIRNSIEISFTHGDFNALLELFGNSLTAEKGKVTVTEFVARLANIVRIQLRKTA